MNFAAVIFDLDGTIIKSEKEWGVAFLKVLKTLDPGAPDTDPHTRGVSVKSNWVQIISKYGIKTDKTPEELETLTCIEYEKLIPEITLNGGVLEFIETLQEGGFPLALATSTNWGTTSKILEHFGLTNYFENITTGEEVTNPKPAPDIFIEASNKLGVDPKDCLVIEDSLSGVTAAKDAEMKVVAVTGGDESPDNLEDADLIVDGFDEITLKAIDGVAQG